MGDEILTFRQLVASHKGSTFRHDVVRNWLPLYPSGPLAQIAAALLTDGHIAFQVRNRKPKMSRIVLYSNCKKECVWFLMLVFRMFGIGGKIIRYRSASGFSKSYSYKAVVHCAELAKLLVAIGVPCGDKTRTAYSVPDWIMEGDSEIKRGFLSILFNFDGSLSLRRRGPATVEMNLATNKHIDLAKSGIAFLRQIILLLSEFGIKAGKPHIRLCKKDKITLAIFITNGRSIINYHKHIGFLNEKKNHRLGNAVSRIYTHRRIKGVSGILHELKEKLGTDRAAVDRINGISILKYTHRQFEHMRRGESDVPLDLLRTAYKILGKAMPDPLAFTGSRELR